MTRAGLLATATLFLASSALAAEKVKPEEVVKRHVEAVSPEGGAFGARVGRGACQLFAAQVGTGSLACRFVLSASPPASRLVLDFGTNQYGSEIFAFDGQNVEIGFANQVGGRRSALATFVSVNEVIVREGLLGGVLNGSWPLAALDERGGKLSYDGLKKLDDRELHRLKYRARKNQGELQVTIWLEPETFRHVATVYATSRAQNMVGDPTQSSRQSDIYYRLEERFSEFRSMGGLALPSKWTVRYEESSNRTVEWRYEFGVEEVERK